MARLPVSPGGSGLSPASISALVFTASFSSTVMEAESRRRFHTAVSPGALASRSAWVFRRSAALVSCCVVAASALVFRAVHAVNTSAPRLTHTTPLDRLRLTDAADTLTSEKRVKRFANSLTVLHGTGQRQYQCCSPIPYQLHCLEGAPGFR